MWRLVRHAFAILVLPFTVTVLVPLWLARRSGTAPSAPETAVGWLVALAGIVVVAAGVALAAACIARFFHEGQGTLAPWDPPVELVVRGPYAYVRNPMISGVVLVLIGEAMVLRSVPHATWAAAFTAINAVYLPLLEEPMLRARFGESYATYCRNVPRLIPRLRPWQPRS
jgi:protein-S-isoprenylcysteine O-methyltransferase Ste14